MYTKSSLTAASIKPSTSTIPKSSTSATGGSVFQSYQAGTGINTNNSASIGAGIWFGELDPTAPPSQTEWQPVNPSTTIQTAPATVLNPLDWSSRKKWLIFGGAAVVIGMIIYFIYFRKKK